MYTKKEIGKMKRGEWVERVFWQTGNIEESLFGFSDFCIISGTLKKRIINT